MKIKPFLKPLVKDMTVNQLLLTWFVLTVTVSTIVIVPMIDYMRSHNKEN